MPTKISDGKETLYSVADVAAKVNEETKVLVDTVINSTAKVAEDSKTILAANQEALEKSYAVYQEYNKAYNSFVLKATQQFLNESLAFRGSLDKVFIDAFKKARVLSLEERQVGLDAADLFQAQSQATAEYFSRLFTTTAKIFPTTALFADFAERTAKVFPTVSTN
jgi:hypothetical protein